MSIVEILILVGVAVIAVAMIYLVKEVKGSLGDKDAVRKQATVELWNSPEFQRLLTDGIHDIFDEETRALATAYAEEKRIVQQLEELVKKGDQINLAELTTSTQKAAWALVLKKAQDAVTLAESALADVQCCTNQAQKSLDYDIQHSCSTDRDKKALKQLADQEKICQEKAQAARQNLDKLVAQSKNVNNTKIHIKLPPQPKD